MSQTTLQQLEAIIVQRKTASADSSYVASLLMKGREAIAQKVGEEAVETIIASMVNSQNDGQINNQKRQVIAEMADLWFHCLVLLVEQGLSSDQVLNELQQRFGHSGLDEKASRVNN